MFVALTFLRRAQTLCNKCSKSSARHCRTIHPDVELLVAMMGFKECNNVSYNCFFSIAAYSASFVHIRLVIQQVSSSWLSTIRAVSHNLCWQFLRWWGILWVSLQFLQNFPYTTYYFFFFFYINSFVNLEEKLILILFLTQKWEK